MSKSKIRVFPSSRVVRVLERHLGPVREFSDLLADMRRGRTTMNGHVLLPFCRVRSAGTWRPYYRAQDIHAFIVAVKGSSQAARSLMEPVNVEIEASDVRHWRFRKLAPAA